MLRTLNTFQKRNSLYIHDKAREFAYSDGLEIERYLKEVLEQATDLSSTSLELESAIQDWATEYHLSSKRANLLRGLDLPMSGHALEIGCGCGAISRYIGEHGLQVDAIEGSAARAEIAHLRCRDISGVQIYCANFNDMRLPEANYDLVFLVGVAEYAARFMDNSSQHDRPIVSFLKKAASALKPGGKLIIAIENRVGLKYMLGAHEDHYARRFLGINNYFGKTDINTYTLSEWQGIFEKTGLRAGATYLPFPDYKVPTVLLSDQFATENTNVFCHLEGVDSRDYIERFDPMVRESLLWQAISSGKSVDRFANSFLFIAESNHGANPPMPRFDFIHLPDFRRHREYCLIARKARGEEVVRRKRVASEAIETGWLTQQVVDEPYHRGVLLSVLWVRALELEPDGVRFTDLVKQYLSFLAERDTLSIDLTPANIVVDAQGRYRAFDEEWQIDTNVGPDLLLFRALVMFFVKAEYAVHRYVQDNGCKTVRDFVVHVGNQAGMALSESLPALVQTENRFQNAVIWQREDNALQRILDKRLLPPEIIPKPVKSRLYWKPRNGIFTETRRLVGYIDVKGTTQKIVFKLPPEATRASAFRFNPCDKYRHPGVGFIQFSRFSVDAIEPGNREKTNLWSLCSGHDIAQYSVMSGVRYGESSIGSRFMVTDDDPWFELNFIPRRKLTGSEYLIVECEISMPFSHEYALAKDQWLMEADKLEAKSRHMAATLDDCRHLEKRYQQVEEEISRIKATPVWRLYGCYTRVHGSVDKAKIKLSRWRGLFHKYGFKGGVSRIWHAAGKRILLMLGRRPEIIGPPSRYELWRDTFLRRVTKIHANGPLISVIMPVYDADAGVLKKAIRSVQKQIYRNWELCIADDASTSAATRRVLERINDKRVKVRFLENNLNISGATNAAASMASGEYLAFMDNDDELADDALNAVAAALVDQPAAELLYSDEDFIRVDGHLDDPHFKTDYNPDLLLSHNYITHLLVMSRALFDRIGGLRGEYDGAQDYDLVLRGVEQAERIVHLPKPVYHWRKSAGSTSLDPLAKRGGHDNARKALGAALQRRGIEARVEDTPLPHFFRVRRALKGEPRVSVIVPFRDKPDLLRLCIESLLEKTTYSNWEVLGISNDSIGFRTIEEMERLRALDERVAFRELNEPFNFSRLVNFGAGHATGEHLVLLNNDIELVTPDWIEGLLEHSQRDEVAAVGAKLYYPNNRIQHAGLGIGLGGAAGHLHKNFRADSPGYFNRLNVIQNVSAVTGAMMMVAADKYRKLGGFDEEQFSVAYNDVDFCLRAREAGYLHVFTPFVEAYHHESLSRGYEDSAAKQQRFQRETENLRARHGEILERGDPYYNPNFDQGRDDFQLELPVL